MFSLLVREIAGTLALVSMSASTLPSVLTLKVPITTAVDDILKFFFLIFQRKQVVIFHVNHLADDSHEISRLVFFEKLKKK